MFKALLGPLRKQKNKAGQVEEAYSVEMSDLSGSSSIEGLNTVDQQGSATFKFTSTLNSSFSTRRGARGTKITEPANPWDACAEHFENIDLIMADLLETAGMDHSFTEEPGFDEASGNDDFERSLIQMEEFTDRLQGELSTLI